MKHIITNYIARLHLGISHPTKYIEEHRSSGKGVRNWFSKHVSASGTMLDHGCASGCTMHDWAEAGWTCVGLDPHKPSVEAGRRLGFDIRVGAGEALPLDDSSFDLVVSLGSFEHSYNLALSLQEIRRVLKKNGHLLIDGVQRFWFSTGIL